MLFQEVAERRVCMQARGGEETELEFDEVFVAGSDIQRHRRQVGTLPKGPKWFHDQSEHRLKFSVTLRLS